MMANPGLDVSGGLVKRQTDVGTDKGIDGHPVLGWFRTPEHPVEQLGQYDGADPNLVRPPGLEPGHHRRTGATQERDPDVGIQQVYHSRSTGGGSSPWGWRKNVSSS